jgi:uncharacterized membrane protein
MGERANQPRWPGLVGTLASMAGLAVAGYLTYEHYTGSSTLACSDKGIVNCLAVTTSSYSKVAGVPVAVLGLVFFAIMLVLQLPATWRRPEPTVRRVRMSWAVVGLGTVVYLLYTELFSIDAICLWCTAVHVLTLAVFVSTVLATLNTGTSLNTGRSTTTGTGTGPRADSRADRSPP